MPLGVHTQYTQYTALISGHLGEIWKLKRGNFTDIYFVAFLPIFLCVSQKFAIFLNLGGEYIKNNKLTQGQSILTHISLKGRDKYFKIRIYVYPGLLFKLWT